MTPELDIFAVLRDQVENKIDDNVDYAAELIGEGKKYKDNQAAAKSLLYKDQHIARLEAEAAALRNAVKGEQKIDAFLDQLKTYKAPVAGDQSNVGTPPMGNDSNQPSNQKAPLSIAEVEALLEQKERSKTESQNYALAVAAAKQAFGADYVQVLAAKAQELGVAPNYLNDLAKTQPNLFIKLVGAEQTNKGGPGLPNPSVNTAGLIARAPSGEKTQKYYSELRKKIGDAMFFKPDVQGEMHRQAQKLGPAFFD